MGMHMSSAQRLPIPEVAMNQETLFVPFDAAQNVMSGRLTLMKVDNSKEECGAKSRNDGDDRRGQIDRLEPLLWTCKVLLLLVFELNVGLS
jgi:hypothetical protein